MRILFDCSDGLVNSETIVDVVYNLTPLLAYCQYKNRAQPRYSVEGFSILLGRGSNVRAQDARGRTCLHLCLDNIENIPILKGRNPKAYLEVLEQIRQALVYLIQHGADVDAVDDIGRSVSELAYDRSYRETRWDSSRQPVSSWLSLGPGSGVRGDLWDVILTDCGYKIIDFRTKKWRWQPSFNEVYTKDVFIALWEGKEHLCPYYDEALSYGIDCSPDESWDTEEDERSGSEKEADCEAQVEACSDGGSDSEDGGCPLCEENEEDVLA
jgi:hypothetical protein